ncbi:MAG TPA: hypothetical protein VNF07_07840 [Acidimicrobiales bacterium]|nr:hypothetical protein [Acidimicrobiales bacterium]
MLIEQPVKLMTPLDSPDCVQPESPPGPPLTGVPPVIDSVTVELSVRTGLPTASSTVTCGCVGSATPPVLEAG